MPVAKMKEDWMNASTDRELLKQVASMAESEVLSIEHSGEENIRLATQELVEGGMRAPTARAMAQAAYLILVPSTDEVQTPETYKAQLTTTQQMLNTEMKYHQMAATNAYDKITSATAAPAHAKTLADQLQASVNAHHAAPMTTVAGQVVPVISGPAPQLTVTPQHFINAMQAARPHMQQMAVRPGPPSLHLPIGHELAVRQLHVAHGGLQQVFIHMLGQTHPRYDVETRSRIASHATSSVFVLDGSNGFARSFLEVTRCDVQAAHLGGLMLAVQQALDGNYELLRQSSSFNNAGTAYSLRPQFTGGGVHNEDDKQQQIRAFR